MAGLDFEDDVKEEVRQEEEEEEEVLPPPAVVVDAGVLLGGEGTRTDRSSSRSVPSTICRYGCYSTRKAAAVLAGDDDDDDDSSGDDEDDEVDDERDGFLLYRRAATTASTGATNSTRAEAAAQLFLVFHCCCPGGGANRHSNINYEAHNDCIGSGGSSGSRSTWGSRCWCCWCRSRRRRQTSGGRRVSALPVVSVLLLVGFLVGFLIFSDSFPSSLLHQQESTSSSSCSCYNSDAVSTVCCRREVLVEHKMGTFLLASIFRPSHNLKLVARVPKPSSSNISKNNVLAVDVDYRRIVTTRNWYDALVSGYLYHRSGRECWLTTDGKPRPNHKNETYDWDQQLWTRLHKLNNDNVTMADEGAELSQQLESLVPYYYYPPRGPTNRSICQYLQDEDERDGMCAYMDCALQRYYSGLVPYYNKYYHNRSEDADNNKNDIRSKTMFVCYEDWMNESRRDSLYEEALRFLYPGGITGSHRTEVKWKEKKLDFDNVFVVVKNNETNSNSGSKGSISSAHPLFEGGHATNHDPELRRRLKQLVQELDEQVFDGAVSKSDAVFGCGRKKTKEKWLDA